MATVLVEEINDENVTRLQNPIIDGNFKTKLYEQMKSDFEESSLPGIFANACSALNYFAIPLPDRQNVSKILCLGKVQSGKTAFFIAVTALAFENDYDIAYVLAGTKNSLRDQNYDRILGNFSNNENVIVLDLNKTTAEEIQKYISEKKKVIVVALKNYTKNSVTCNLGKLCLIAETFSNLKTLIIDDEGDEVTPGAPKLVAKGKKAGATHDSICDVIFTPKCCTFLSVTATPQANLLLSTMDFVSPNYVVLVHPGEGYTGGNAFHDVLNNPHVIKIEDSDDFEDSIPDSFMKAFNHFIFGCCLERVKGKTEKKFSMLVHPSSYKAVHAVVANKILGHFATVKNNLMNKGSLPYRSALEEIKVAFNDYIKENQDCKIVFSQIEEEIKNVLPQIKTIIMNSGNEPTKEELAMQYKIYIGGNMLGRGLTIPNLFTTYMYRDNKSKTPIDTLYQRARWFGYKSSYFDICKVYMTDVLRQKFCDTVASENDMWNTINAFLLTDINAKRIPRIFRLDNEKLALTRTSVAKTVTYNRVNPGYTYDKSIWLSEDEKKANRELFKVFFENNKKLGKEIQFSNNLRQTHYVISMKYTDFLDNFLTSYNYPKGSVFGQYGLQSIRENIKKGAANDEVKVVVMRYKTGQYRSVLSTGTSIKELPQSWDEKSGYSGDKFLPNLQDKFHFQIHLVYTEENNPNNFIPMLAMNNPITELNVKYVTGDNNYDEN